MYDNMDRRKLLGYLAASGAIGIAGCTGGGGGSSGNQNSNGNSSGNQNSNSSNWVRDQNQVSDPQKVEWLNLGSMEGDPASTMHANQWTKKSGIEAVPRAIPTADALSKSRTLLQAKNVRPDIYQLADTWMWDLGSKGFFEDVSQYVTTVDSWVPGAKKVLQFPIDGLPEFDNFTYQNGLYGIPWYSEGWITFTNMDVLEEAGLSRNFTPSSFTELREACDQLTDVVETPILFPFSTSDEGLQVFQDLVLRAGGHFYDGKNPDFTNDGFVNALDFLLGLVSDGYAPSGVTSLTEGQTTTQFFQGNAGFQFNALGNLFLPGKQLPINKPPEDVARIHLYPTPDSLGYEETATGNLIVVGANLSVFSKRKKPAAKFMNFITTQKAQADEIIKEGNLPLRADVFNLNRVKQNIPYAGTMQTQLAGYDKLIYPNATNIEELLYQEITSAFANDRSAQKTAKRIQQKAENI